MISRPSSRAALFAALMLFVKVHHYCGDGVEKCKNKLFRNFYAFLLTAVTADLGLCIRGTRTAFLGLIALLVVLIHRWDDYIDEPKWRLRPDQARARTYTLAQMRRITRYLGQCGMEGWEGFEVSLDYVEGYFDLERRIMATGRCGRGMDLHKILRRCNCDYAQYNALFELYLRSLGVQNNTLQKIRLFMDLYVVVDIVCDHITDHMDDREQGCFNTLIWKGGIGSYEELVANGTLQRFCELGLEYAGKAREALKGLEGYPVLHEFLSRCLEAEAAGLELLIRYNFFVDLPEDIRQRLLEITLKPFPWSRETREEVKAWLRHSQTLFS